LRLYCNMGITRTNEDLLKDVDSKKDVNFGVVVDENYQ
jgi:hypothetical protein